MNGKNSVSKVIFAFLTAFFLFCALLFCALFAAGSKQAVSAALQKSGYCEKAALEAEESLDTIARAGGFEEGFFDGIVTAQTVSENLSLFVNSSLGSETLIADVERARNEISRRVFAEAEEKISGYSLETREVLNQTVELCVGEVLSVSQPAIIGRLCALLARFRAAFAVAAVVFLLLFSVSFFVIKRQSKMLLKTSLISAALMLGVGPAVAINFLWGTSLGIESEAVRNAVLCFLLSLLESLVFLAAAVLVFSFFARKKDPVPN